MLGCITGLAFLKQRRRALVKQQVYKKVDLLMLLWGLTAAKLSESEAVERGIAKRSGLLAVRF